MISKSTRIQPKTEIALRIATRDADLSKGPMSLCSASGLMCVMSDDRIKGGTQ